jgi:excisionase family DNA binding protein
MAETVADELSRWLRPSQAARLLDCSADTVRRLANEGKIRSRRTLGGLELDRGDVRRVARERRATGQDR